MADSLDDWNNLAMSRPGFLSFRKIILIGLPVMLMVLLSGSAYWLLNSSSGAAWLWSRLEALETVDLQSSRVMGDLDSGFIVEDMKYRSTDLDLSVNRAEVKVGIDWWPMSIQVGRLSLQDVGIVTRSTEDSVQIANEDTDIRAVLKELELPVPLEVDDAVLTNVNFQQDGSPPFTLFESVRFRAALDAQLVVDHLDLLAEEFEARLQGKLRLEPPFELAASVEGRYEITGEAGESVLTLPFRLESTGDLDKIQLNITSLENGLRLAGEILDPVINPAWNIKVVLDHLPWPDNHAAQEIKLSELNLVSHGGIHDWSFELNSEVRTDVWQDGLFSVSGSGSTTGIEVDQAEMTGPGVDFGFNGHLDWSGQVEAGLNAAIKQLDLSPWLSDWPEGEQLAGDLELNWSGSGLRIPSSQLTVTGTGLMVSIEADMDTDANTVDAQLDWSALRWPLTGTVDEFSSESGQLSIHGNADDWVANGQLDLQVGEYPQGRFEIQGGGNRTSTQLVIPGGAILGGSVSGKAEADWSGDLNWNASIQTLGIDPEPLLPGWPGRLDSDVEISGQSQPRQIHINLLSLQGVLRGVPLTAHGGLEATAGVLAFKSLEVRTDDAVLELNGTTSEQAGATIRFSGLLPSSLLQGASGSLELESRYSSYASQPLTEVQVQARDLSWKGLRIMTLAINTSETVSTGPVPALQVDAAGISWEDMLFDKLSLSLNPVGEQHELKTSLVGEDLILNSVMSLSPENDGDLINGSWNGVLSELEVAVEPAYIFELLKPSAIEWSSGSVSLEPVCLSESKGASLCLDLDYWSNGDWSLVADAAAVPINYLRDLLELDLHFEQLLEGRLEWHQPHNQAPTGGADFRITEGRIQDSLDNEFLAETNEGRFAFTLQNGNLESGVLDIEFPGNGFIDVDFDVLDIVSEGRRELQGRAIVRLDHLKLAGQLVLPRVDAIDGQFESNIQLMGTLGDPGFDGSFKFSNGLIDYAPIGLKLEDIELEGQLKKRDRGDFKGRLRAGEGVASFDGQFLFDDIGSAQMELDLAGEKLLLVNTDTLKILTETELRIAVSPQRMDINGRIMVPSARLTPDNLLLGEVRDSDDLVIETPGVETDSVVKEKSTENQIYGQLEVAFGDDVFIKVPGIETSLSGSTLFNWSGEPIPMAKGGYRLKGTVDVYGPRLQIRNGSISFPDVPANNPLLNIRAGRDIFGNTQVRRAGVQVIGNLKRPVLEAYTVPVTNQDRAWTLLITGTDFDQGQGVNGFDIGTYIAPRLYVSYGVSLFEDENVISARYDIRKGFGVKVTSGQRETGIDISYTIEK